MQNFQSFVDSHRPAQVEWDLQSVRIFSAKAGLEVHRYQEERWLLVLWGDLLDTPKRVKTTVREGLWPFQTSKEVWVDHSTERERAKSSLLLSWEHTLSIYWEWQVEGEELVFSPYVANAGREIGPRLIEAAGIEPVRVQLPERVVWMPVPSWVQVHHMDLVTWSEVTGSHEFVSVVQSLLAEFNQEMEARVAGNTCYDVWYNNGSGYYEADPNGHAVWAPSPEDALQQIPGSGFPDRVVTLHGWRNPNNDPSYILARD